MSVNEAKKRKRLGIRILLKKGIFKMFHTYHTLTLLHTLLYEYNDSVANDKVHWRAPFGSAILGRHLGPLWGSLSYGPT